MTPTDVDEAVFWLEEKDREAALITFIVTVSGMSFFGLGSALWGLIAGLIFSNILSWSGFGKTIPNRLRGFIK